MRRDKLVPVAYDFALPPFTVRCASAPIPNNYKRYALYLDDVCVRVQITYPEAADGWVGVSDTLHRESETLTTEQCCALRLHQNQQLTHTHRTLLSHGAVLVKSRPRIHGHHS